MVPWPSVDGVSLTPEAGSISTALTTCSVSPVEISASCGTSGVLVTSSPGLGVATPPLIRASPISATAGSDSSDFCSGFGGRCGLSVGARFGYIGGDSGHSRRGFVAQPDIVSNLKDLSIVCTIECEI